MSDRAKNHALILLGIVSAVLTIGVQVLCVGELKGRIETVIVAHENRLGTVETEVRHHANSISTIEGRLHGIASQIGKLPNKLKVQQLTEDCEP